VSPAGLSLQQRLAAALDLHRRGKLYEAEQVYRAVLDQYPRCFDALHLLGVIAIERGALDDGVKLVRRALEIEEAQPAALYHLASALLTKGDTAGALSAAERAVDLQGDQPDLWLLHGNALQRAGRVESSVKSYERSLALEPVSAECWNNLAVALRELRRHDRALACAERALSLNPTYPSALNNRALLDLDGERYAAAIEGFRKALAIDPRRADARHNLGTALMRAGRPVEAGESFARLASQAPTFPHALGNLLYAKRVACDWADVGSLHAQVVEAVRRGEAADVPMSFLCTSGAAQLQLRCAQVYTQEFYPGVLEPPPATVRRSGERIRVAYLSGDFGEHALSYLLAGVLEHHDLARFETIALSWGRAGDGPLRERLEASFSRFIDITNTSDADAARMMRELDVDIAVDLTAHTWGHRTNILARRAAPVQVNYLGLPATMGAPYIDYLIADSFLIPPHQLHHYAEKVVWLPVFQPNDDRRRLTPDGSARTDHGLQPHDIVLCAFNNTCKINPECFTIWMNVLRTTPSAVLWLLAPSVAVEENLRREAEARGVDASRLVFAPRVAYADYLARYAHADLFLDTFPFNGGATASDALSMALPVLTCAGDSFSSRMAGSLLSALDLHSLITHSPAEYEATALALAAQPERLRTLRERLIGLRSTHAFFDSGRYCRSLESAYRVMLERRLAGLSPAEFSIAAGSDDPFILR
jgi:protein O-GlcNAc transferase